MDLVAERTSIYNIVRPDRSTIVGRPQFAVVDFLIEQQNPKFFYSLGDNGTIAPNLGWNLFISPTIPRSDGQYVQPVTQNVQGILGDAVGGFNTRGPGSSSPTGYVMLPSGPMGLGPVVGKPGWTLIAIVRRNPAPIVGTLHPILSNISGFSGLELGIGTGPSQVYFQTNNGTTLYSLNGSSVWSAGDIVYVMVQVFSPSSNTWTINIYVQGNSGTDGTTTITGTSSVYVDPATVPLIGRSGYASATADLQIARLATFDFLVPLSAWTNIYNYGSSLQGR